jgi:ribosomal protein S18 acetylase RimI-like enzyme
LRRLVRRVARLAPRRFVLPVVVAVRPAGEHGTGIGALLLDAVVSPESSAELGVAEANPRARRFYEKHGFTAEGARFIDALDIVEIRMVRDR